MISFVERSNKSRNHWFIMWNDS